MPFPEDAPVFVISVAAQLAGMHPQTLRQYDRLGLVNPGGGEARPVARRPGRSTGGGWRPARSAARGPCPGARPPPAP
ncbi:MAG TPA: MerR family DNA-binding transcriptional regulator, partial [Mycobacteriales bacterium]|nr:MerR family DNA-binding transcriptional regulator [Mycobacteriales bacterium]